MAMDENEDWCSPAFREKALAQIEEAVRRTGNPHMIMKTPSEMENEVFSKASSKVEYLSHVACLLVYIRDFYKRVASHHPPFCACSVDQGWRTPASRKKVLAVIEDAVKRSTNPNVMESAKLMERRVYFKAKSRIEYYQYVVRLLIYICDTYAGSWRSPAFRQNVLAQIEDAVKGSGNPNMITKSPKVMEYQIYSKANSKERYLSIIARLLVYIRCIRPSGPQQPQPTNMA